MTKIDIQKEKFIVLDNRKTDNYMKGLKTGIGIGVAYIPFGITIGLISKGFGMKLVAAFLMSFGIYAGSAESMFLKTIYEQNAGFLEVIISILMINLRYVLLNLVVYRQLDSKTTLFEKILAGIGLTDETVAYATIKKEKNAWYIIGLNTVPYFSFGISTVVGSLFGGLIPEMFRNSLSFILYSAFLSLLISALKDSFKYMEVVIIVIIMKLVFMYTPILKEISGGWSMIIIMIASSLTYALMHYREENRNNGRKTGKEKL